MSEFINFLKQADIFFQFRLTQKDLYFIIQGEADVMINPATAIMPSARNRNPANLDFI